MTGYKDRQDEWLKVTGLKLSNARFSKVLPWMSDCVHPTGFDHTRVYYSPEHKIHILITEPYHTATEALSSLKKLSKCAGGGCFDYAFGGKNRGLWNPGECWSLLVAKTGTKKYLDFLAYSLHKT